MRQAVLIIDFQHDLVEGTPEESGVHAKENVIEVINQVVQEAHNDHHAIVFIRDLDVANGQGAGFLVHPSIQIPNHAVTFDKAATNSFHGTPLLGYLKEQQIEHVVILGCKTEHCIDTAVRSATVNGFDVTLVADGHTTNGSVVLSAEQMIAHHNQVLHGHYNVEHFAMVRPSTEKLFEPIHDQYRM
ncbi:isochorismatase family protein [Exiguobacterium antarcticum]|uniref:Isochorismatase family protein n=1 Tax=Exiguobacterium antarcticum TaxID=132920 RepID=A0ABT6R1T0_9BACL|nr:isochorismatase family protein [Exiguobacterium antarcticum]AFS69309.1 Isochorismatase hydrolase [Exiguobacterium antarcticum B7]MDI3234906.1 isochorismatase family protein [Exiguobacterium antarcticum]